MNSRVVSFRLSDRDIKDLDFMAREAHCNRTNAFRQIIQVVRIICNTDLTLDEAIKEEFKKSKIKDIKDHSLFEVLESIPIITTKLLMKKEQHFLNKKKV